MEKEIRTPRFANKIEVIGEKPGSPVTRSRSKRSVYSRFEPPPSAKFVCLLLVSFGISLASTVFAQDDPLPAATGNITSPARNLSADQATDARGVNTIGTHQRIPRQSSGSTSSAGTVTVRTVNEIDGDLKAEDGASVRIGDTNFSNANAGSVSVRTESKLRGGKFSDGSTGEIGVVDLTNYSGSQVNINTNNELGGEIRTNDKSTVSIGGVNVGNRLRQTQFEDNRDNLTASARPGIPNSTTIPQRSSTPTQAHTAEDSGLSPAMAQEFLGYLEFSEKLSNGKSPNQIGQFRKVAGEALVDDIRADFVDQIRQILEQKFKLPGFIDNAINKTLNQVLASGFGAAAYENPNTNELVVVFEGTNPFSPSDLTTNVANAFGDTPPLQYQFAETFTREVQKKYPDASLTITGHSLGGGLAAYSTAKTASDGRQRKLVTFNSAGLWSSTIREGFQNFDHEANKNVEGHFIRLEGDLVSGEGDYFGEAILPVDHTVLFHNSTQYVLPGFDRIFTEDRRITLPQDHTTDRVRTRLEQAVSS